VSTSILAVSACRAFVLMWVAAALLLHAKKARHDEADVVDMSADVWSQGLPVGYPRTNGGVPAQRRGCVESTGSFRSA